MPIMTIGTGRGLLYSQPVAAAGGGPFTFVAGVSTSVVGSGGGSSGSINTTGAGLLVAVTSYYQAATGLTFADSKSNSWTPLTVATSTNTKCNVYYSIPTSVGSSHTISLTGTNIFTSLVFAAFAFGAASPADQQSTNNGSGTSMTSSSITPAFDNELVIAGLAANASGGTITGPGGNFTVIDVTRPGLSGNYIGGAGAYSIQTTATAEAPTWTHSISSDWSTKMASFKVS